MMTTIRTRGFLYLVGTLVNKLVPERVFRFRIFRIFELEEIDLDANAGRSQANAPRAHELMFRWCETEAEIADACRLTFFRPDGSGAPQQACLAIANSEPVGGVWIGRDYFNETELGLRICLNEDQTWLFSAFVEKQHRRTGVYRRLLNHVLADQQQTVFASINPTNKASIKSHSPYIRRTAGTCVAVRCFGWSKCWASGQLRVDGNEITILAYTESN
ncbi:GNAT family N-acetyltransferase [Rubripirellula reticaptiva]|nr:GNAT family N-acetyltransferase [Rubripirellula reticaptiva]